MKFNTFSFAVHKPRLEKILLCMKLTTLILLIALLQCSAKGYGQKVNLTETNTPLKKVLLRISKQTGYVFFYDSKDVINKNVNVILKNIALPDALTRLFKDQSLTYKIIDKTIILQQTEPVFAIGNQMVAVTIPVTGQVFDENDKPLPGVTITLKDGKPIGITDANGKFNITVPDEKAVIVFSFVGFTRKEMPVTTGSVMAVKLERLLSRLSEVVVVGYGSQSKKLLTGAIQSINGTELKDIPAPSVTQKLQGKLSGVQISQTTGEPGASLQVAIRGAASISTGASPLYVVDGFPLNGDLRNVNPDEIESISVLKDATATALYGSRAAFGVVLVTTKSGKAGKTSISFNAYTGIQVLPQKGRPKLMNGEEWAEFRKENYEDLGQPVPAVFQNPSQYGKGYDWYAAMFRHAPMQNYNISITTGNEFVKNATTVSYQDQDGILINSNYKRFALRNNLTYQLADNVKLGINVAPSYVVNSNPPTDGWFNSGQGLLLNAMLTPPILAYQNPDGSMPVSVTKTDVTIFPTPNWVRSAGDITRKNNAYAMLANTFLEYSPIKNLVLKSTFNVQTEQSSFNFYQPSTASVSFATTPNTVNANLSQNTSKFFNWLNENTVNYTKDIGRHSLNLLGGYTIQRFRSDATSVSGSNFPDDRIRTIDAALVKNNSTMDIQEWSMLSYLARLNYNYDKKYLFSASIRRDGSSRFGINNKWGTFPAFSAGWVATEESFLKDVKWLSFLKFKGGYGVVGNNNIGNYTQYPTVNTSNAIFGSSVASGVAVTGLGNTNLGWESTKELDLGIELSVLDGHISFNYDYYNKKTSNMLLRLQVPQESGFGSLVANVGEVNFWGHEFSVDTKNLTGKFKWNTNFNISFGDNKVLALSALTDKIYSSSGTGIDMTITKVGGRIGQFWGLVQDGVYVNQADFDRSPKTINSQVGTIKFKDLNGDGLIKTGNDDGDRTVIGNPFPKFLYGMTNTFVYLNFDLAVVIAGSYGNKIARMYDAATTNLDGVFNVNKEVENRWRSPSDPGDGVFGKSTGGTTDQRAYFHSGFVFDGSYLAIKNITLGYTWPIKNNKYVKSARLYSSVQQAFMFTNYQGNPEVNTTDNGGAPGSLGRGLDYNAYPIPRTITLGFNVTLK